MCHGLRWGLLPRSYGVKYTTNNPQCTYFWQYRLPLPKADCCRVRCRRIPSFAQTRLLPSIYQGLLRGFPLKALRGKWLIYTTYISRKSILVAHSVAMDGPMGAKRYRQEQNQWASRQKLFRTGRRNPTRFRRHKRLENIAM